MNVTTIGFDIAKGVIQIHGVDAAGIVTLRKRMSRAGALKVFGGLKPCLVGMEACGGAHFWARELAALGHTVRLISPVYVKPYVKRSKTDAADAAAICEAVSRPHMRFVPVKSREEQALAQAYKTRGLLVAQRTALVNALRAHLTEFGIVAPLGPAGAARLIGLVRSGEEPLPELARRTLLELADMIEATQARIGAFDARLKELAAADEASRRLMKVPGVGPVAAGTLRGARRRCHALPNGAGFRGLARPDAAPELKRRQSAHRRDQQGRQSGTAHLARDGAVGRAALCSGQPRQGLAMARRHDQAPSAAGRGRGHGRQDGARHLGHAGARRKLPADAGLEGGVSQQQFQKGCEPLGSGENAREMMTDRSRTGERQNPQSEWRIKSAFR
jgi:transposase